MDTLQKLALLRLALKNSSVQACLIPSADPHLSEYLPDYWQIRLWLTGFTGSVGTVVVTQDFAGVWVDSRYWVQAETELAGSGFQLMKLGAVNEPTHVEWLASKLTAGDTVGVDGRALSLSAREALLVALTESGIKLRLDVDFPGKCWADRPVFPDAAVIELALDYAGDSRVQKLARLRRCMQECAADWHLISTLDDIAWLLNLRGCDVNYNPVFVAHLLLGPSSAQLFVGAGKIDADLGAKLECDGIQIRRYDEAADTLAHLPPGQTVLFDPARTTCGLIDQIKLEKIQRINPTTLMKSRKTDAELNHVRRVMEQDGAALCEFFAWFEAHANLPGHPRVDELLVDEKLIEMRSKQAGFVSPSFSTIAAYNANGAMPHYRATPTSFAKIEGDGLLLIDSGGQYLGGTTDITRVVPVGRPSQAQKEDYTAVLRAMIALSRLKFPEGVASPMLDAVARAPLWDRLVDYGHGTGHGVGYFLNVHEGPQVISHRAQPAAHTAMRQGMITSNEPGLYRPGKWGIRIENLVCNQLAGSSEFGDFLQFETLTLCPIDTRLIVIEQLRVDERDWLNSYHQTVRSRLSTRLSGAALDWLLVRTESLG